MQLILNLILVSGNDLVPKNLGSGDVAFDYIKNGADWADLVIDGNNCGGHNQSPIDLTRDMDDAVWDGMDNFQKMYSNEGGNGSSVAMHWDGHTMKTVLTANASTMDSRFCKVNLGGAQRFNGTQFHFHHMSEHTIDGQRYDLEMHTVHDPGETVDGSDIVAGAMGVLFSVDNWDKDSVFDWEIEIIDKFFESMAWPDDISGDDYDVDMVAYGDLMNMVNTRDRWVYTGSVTTPPCATAVYWNMVTTVYPIKQEHMDEYIHQMERVSGLKDVGNFREIQKMEGQNVMLIKGEPENKEKAYMISTYTLVAVCVLLIIAVIVFSVLWAKEKKDSDIIVESARLNLESKDTSHQVEGIECGNTEGASSYELQC